MSGLVFAAFLALYAFTMAPALAPYRDTGEMASAAATLSVAHPTSYPSYVMLGRLAQAVPLGNPAYRLNLLSAAAAALACALLCWAVRRRWGAWAGLGAAALLGLNAVFWSVAQVQEMYSLWTLLAVTLMALALRLSRGHDARLWRLFCFGFGLALTNRLDLLLWAPGLLWLALSDREEPRAPLWASLAFLIVPAAQIALSANWPIVPLIVATVIWRRPAGRGWRWAAQSAAWAAAGLSAYLFLPIRSAGAPWLDWNHPAAAANLVDSLLRTRYGGTLDLLSKSYATGELFGETLKLYGAHLWDCFCAPGLALAAWGCARAARREPRRWLGQAACYWWAGPVFLFIANLPPNPHAAAIVEPHYLLSDAVLLFWAAEGLGAAAELHAWAPAAAAALLLAVPLARGRVARFDRREHLFSYDFARLALASAPKGAVLVAKKDVQLYALWSYQTLQGWRPDVRVVAQGLAGSRWYQADWRRRDPALELLPLTDADGWRRLAALNGGAVYATPDAELPAELAPKTRPRGLLFGVGDAAKAGDELWALDARRGDYRYEAQPDFFTSDLIDGRAQALLRAGAEAASAGRADQSRERLQSSWAMHWALPESPLYLGYLDFTAGRYEAALRVYALAAGVLDELSVLAGRYRALPQVAANIRRSGAEALTQLGVVNEKLGRRDEALRCYEASLDRQPTAQAHYDLAVLFWGRDWARAEQEFQEALRLEPGRADAAKYLQALRSRRR